MGSGLDVGTFGRWDVWTLGCWDVGMFGLNLYASANLRGSVRVFGCSYIEQITENQIFARV
jgi:hypothetical protein